MQQNACDCQTVIYLSIFCAENLAHFLYSLHNAILGIARTLTEITTKTVNKIRARCLHTLHLLSDLYFYVPIFARYNVMGTSKQSPS